MSTVRRTTVLVFLLLMAGCSAQPARLAPADAPGYVDAPEALEAANWGQATEVELLLSSYDFTPDRLTFVTGKPYRLKLTNTAGSDHTFTAPGFFRAIAVRRLVSREGEETNPRLEEIGFDPGETKTLEFIAVRPGSYDFLCDLPLHEIFGMQGSAFIEEG